MEYDLEFYEKALHYWLAEVYPKLVGLLPQDVEKIAVPMIEKWLSANNYEAKVEFTYPNLEIAVAIIAPARVWANKYGTMSVIYPLPCPRSSVSLGSNC